MNARYWHLALSMWLGKVEINSEAHSIPRRINVASCSQIWAGTYHVVILKYLFPTVLHSRGRMRSSTRKEGSGGGGCKRIGDLTQLF